MPMYEFECSNPKCEEKKGEPFEFDAMMKMAESDVPAECPKCETNNNVKKVVRTAFPKSKSWGA